MSLPGPIEQIATSNSDTYALVDTSQGPEVYGWGYNDRHQLGNPKFTQTLASNPVEVDFSGLPAGVTITSLPDPMPFDTGLAMASNGQIYGWGLNPAHVLCSPAGSEATPVALPFTNVSLASGAGNHGLYEATYNGVAGLYGCGLNTYGELGVTTNPCTTTPLRAPTLVAGLPPGQTVRELTTSWQDSGALMSDGSYYDWGFNRFGQLGATSTTSCGTTTPIPYTATPVQVALDAPAIQVFQGGSNEQNGQAIASLSDGTVWAWGYGKLGQLGNGVKLNSTTPVQASLPVLAPGETWASVATGGAASYAVDPSGDLYAWGSESKGALGNGVTTGVVPTPAEVITADGTNNILSVTSTALNEAATTLPAG